MSAPVAGTYPPVPDRDEQRNALQRILASSFLDRAPNLVHLLRYVCEQTFDGRADGIKEYNIAIEALGRDSGFDQKKDAIVRVEAHRLRKRLADYYRGPGVNDPVIVCLPPGTYVPRFTYRVSDSEKPAAPVTVENPVASAPRPPFRGRRLWAAAFGIVLLVALVSTAAIGLFTGRPTPPAQAAVSSAVNSVSPVAAAEPGIRIMCGLQSATAADRDGVIWSSDRYFEGGDILKSPPRPIARTTTPEMYLTRREGDFSYRIPLSRGPWELRLHFAETVFGEGNIAGGGESSRIMTITANGNVLPITDILSEAGGPNIAIVRVFRDIEPGPDGFLTLKFGRQKEVAFVNAIEIAPGTRGRLTPVRIAARSAPFDTPGGQHWTSDRHFLGGQTVSRQEPVAGANDQGIFRGERFGNFTYEIPVDPSGRYSVTLHFAEAWFGPGRPGGGGEASRLFDVNCNGRALIRNFDVFRVSGGSLRAVSKTFHGLEPTAHGTLLLTFMPVRNYAMVNAIEVLEELR